MNRFAQRGACLLGASAIALGLLVGTSLTSVAGASETATATSTCSGTPANPGVLAGTHTSSVTVSGLCEVNAGNAIVKGNVTVRGGGALVAAFALNDKTHKGFSSLTVWGDVIVARGGAALLGCEAQAFACLDDPNQKAPTLESRDYIAGSIREFRPLGVIVHNSSIVGNVTENGGGGGFTCTPEGIFAAFGSPVYSDYEDNAIGGNFVVSGVTSCWFGAVRDYVHGNATFWKNKMADPDGNEDVSNVVGGSLVCGGNSPAVQYGDTDGHPNVVGKQAYGQCGFKVMLHNPPPNGPLDHISIRGTV